jgi:glycopeptide antibiotics resistance protein
LKQNVKREIGRLSFLLLAIYVLIVLYFVLFSDRLGRTDTYETYRYNLNLFNEIHRFIRYRDQVSPGAFILNLLGNLFVLFPFGFLIPLWRMKKTGVVRIALYAFLFSLGIEILQLVTKVGVFDVDDLLLNILGAILGYNTYSTLYFLFYHLKKRKE